MAIKDYSTEPDMNTTISGINIAEGCAPSGINNAIRQLMADVKAGNADLDTTLRALIAQEVAKCLKTSGGTLTGAVFTSAMDILSSTRNDLYLNFNGGSNYLNGATFTIYGKDAAATPGWAVLRASDGTTFNQLILQPSGRASINGKAVITEAGGTMTGGIEFGGRGGITYRNTDTRKDLILKAINSNRTDGAVLILKSADEPGETSGVAQLSAVAADGTASNVLLYPDGRWKKDGKDVLTIVASWDDGNGNWYHKYSDGWIEQGGNFATSGTTTGTTTLHLAFASANYTVLLGMTGGTGSYSSSSAMSVSVIRDNKTTTSFNWNYCGSGVPTIKPGFFDWYACGY